MDWGPDPSLDWPSRFHPGDVVRLDDGRVAVVAMVLDSSPSSSPPKYELLLHYLHHTGAPDDDLFSPWRATPAPDPRSLEEARAQGLLEGFSRPDEN
jgi:hypothetical protein